MVDLIKNLADCESQLEKCKERLIFRCNDFNNNVAVRLFDPSVNDGDNFCFNNVKRACKALNVDIDASMANLIVKRFDSNFDNEMTYSDVTDIFKPNSIALQREVERRTVFDERRPTAKSSKEKHMHEYIRDVLDQTIEAVSLAQKISLSLVKRPQYSIERALSVLQQRGASPVALGYYRSILELHHIMIETDDFLPSSA